MTATDVGTTNKLDPIFYAKPSLRRAYFYAFLYAGVVAFARTKVDLRELQIGPGYDPLLVALGILLVLLALAQLRSWCTAYIITGQDVRAISGILARRMAVVPYKRITNVAARQSVLERILGLVNVYIDAAGGDFTEVVFRRITKTEAQQAGAIINKIIAEQKPLP